jgi:hypothetical protein
VRSLRFIITISILSASLFASEIREFDLKTIEHLGNELTRVSQSPEKGATTPARKRAKQTAIRTLQGKLFNIHYDYVVLGDPDGAGFLVYALGATNNPYKVVIAGHFRVTVSASGEKAERIDALSRGLSISNNTPKTAGMYMAQIVSTKPIETLIYTSNLTKLPIAVATPPNGEVWFIENGGITKSSTQK